MANGYRHPGHELMSDLPGYLLSLVKILLGAEQEKSRREFVTSEREAGVITAKDIEAIRQKYRKEEIASGEEFTIGEREAEERFTKESRVRTPKEEKVWQEEARTFTEEFKGEQLAVSQEQLDIQQQTLAMQKTKAGLISADNFVLKLIEKGLKGKGKVSDLTDFHESDIWKTLTGDISDFQKDAVDEYIKEYGLPKGLDKKFGRSLIAGHLSTEVIQNVRQKKIQSLLTDVVGGYKPALQKEMAGKEQKYAEKKLWPFTGAYSQEVIQAQIDKMDPLKITEFGEYTDMLEQLADAPYEILQLYGEPLSNMIEQMTRTAFGDKLVPPEIQSIGLPQEQTTQPR